MRINNTTELKEMLRQGQYAWPGGYPLFFIMSDGSPLSFEAVRENFRLCVDALKRHLDDGWRVAAVEINYEEPDLLCAHTGKPIDCAYRD